MGAGKSCNVCRNFYPRSPCGERPETAKTSNADTKFLSTLSLRRATEAVSKYMMKYINISIHALLAESDHFCYTSTFTILTFLSTLSLRRATFFFYVPLTIRLYFYPRSPCGERPNKTNGGTHHENFYPRSPCGERRMSSTSVTKLFYFYPRSPCGERREIYMDGYKIVYISIHALLAESDSKSAQNSGALLRI